MINKSSKKYLIYLLELQIVGIILSNKIYNLAKMNTRLTIHRYLYRIHK